MMPFRHDLRRVGSRAYLPLGLVTGVIVLLTTGLIR